VTLQCSKIRRDELLFPVVTSNDPAGRRMHQHAQSTETEFTGQARTSGSDTICAPSVSLRFLVRDRIQQARGDK
jgi:hypothetical protein